VGADGQACDDVRGVSGFRGFRDIPNGRVVGGCVVVREWRRFGRRGGDRLEKRSA
jgi:hypothetical protein